MFAKGHTPSHSGQQVTAEPIRDIEVIKKIKQKLSSKTRDYCLFVLGINTAFRCGDLLNIRIGDVRGKVAGDDVVVREEKTGKTRRVTLNDCSAKAIHKLRGTQPNLDDEDFLFQSQRSHLTVSYVNRLIKSWCRDVGLEGNYSTHSLRKTWAYHARVTFGVSIEVLMLALNHSSPAQTLAYICIQSHELKELYANSL